jgi:hypothetical protein
MTKEDLLEVDGVTAFPPNLLVRVLLNNGKSSLTGRAPAAWAHQAFGDRVAPREAIVRKAMCKNGQARSQ